jgi:hypothetical protein
MGAQEGGESGAGGHAGSGPDPRTRHFGIFYPTHHVVASLRDAATAQAAEDELHRAGWSPAELHHSTGEEVLEERRRFLQERSLAQRLGELVGADEREARDEYLEDATRGAHFLAVYAPTAERVERARTVLSGHGAWSIRHYGERVMTDLPAAPGPPGP